MEIEIQRGRLRELITLAGLALLLALGYGLSPRDRAGQPRLLLPDVRAVEDYRRAAVGWADAWRRLDADLSAVLAAPGRDLLQHSRQAQAAFDQAFGLAGQVDGLEAPATLLGLREQANAAAAGYTEAAIAVNRWLSAPTDDHLDAAQARLTAARAALAGLEANQWLAGASDTAAEPAP